MKVEFFALTHTGKVRDHNEDNFIVCENLASNGWIFSNGKIVPVGDKGSLMFVADGMGGANAGEVASSIARETIRHEFNSLTSTDAPGKTLKKVILKAHDNILQRQQFDPATSNMGTTAIIGWIIRNKLILGWCGDSRAYLVRKNNRPYPLTDDHSLVWEMVLKNKLTPEEARVHPQSNFITQNLGNQDQLPKPSIKNIDLRVGDLVVLCSDGLNGMLPDEVIFEISLRQNSLPEIVRELVNKANENGGTDNITVVAARIHELDVVEKTVESNRKRKLKYAIYFIILMTILIGFWFMRGNRSVVPDTHQDSNSNSDKVMSN